MTDYYLKSHTPRRNLAEAQRQVPATGELLRIEVHTDGSASIVELSTTPLQPGQATYAPSTGTKTYAGTIAMTPTWSEMLQPLLAVYRDGNPNAQLEAFEELKRMAHTADQCGQLKKRVLAYRLELTAEVLGASGPLAQVAMKLNGIMNGSYPRAKD